MSEAKPNTASPKAKESKPFLGMPKLNFLILGLFLLLLWFLALDTGSTVFLVIVGLLTAAVAGGLFWLWRLSTRQKGLMTLLEGAVTSPEARRAALEKLSTGKDANDPTNVFARAQLEAAEDPAKALETIETLNIATIPVYLQDDVALLRSQLYLRFGRFKDARPLVDRINVDNPERKEARSWMVAVVAEVWARTGKHTEANTLLDTVDFAKEKEEMRTALLAARVFARFAAGKKVTARRDLEALSAIDANHLGRFILPRFRAHPELQRMAREVAEKNPQIRRMSQPRHSARNGRMR